jgi:hypothetical protein
MALLDSVGALDDFIKGDYEKAVPKIENIWVAFKKGHGSPPSEPSALTLGQAGELAGPPVGSGPGAFIGEPGAFLGRNSGLMRMVTPGGQPGVAVAQTPGELNLFSRFQRYDEEIRGKLMDLAPRVASAESALRESAFSGFPTEFDSAILRLLKQI